MKSYKAFDDRVSMNELFHKRLVQIESDGTIDSFPEGAVVYVKNAEPVVFAGRNGDMLTFYYAHFSSNRIIELTTPRSYVQPGGNMIILTPSSRDQRVDLTPESGESYRMKKDDLVALGLMK
jgi:hypothetical protein